MSSREPWEDRERSDEARGHPAFERSIVAWCPCGHPIYDDDGWVTCWACGRERRRKEAT